MLSNFNFRQTEVITVGIIFTLLAIIAVAGRLIARLVVIKNGGIDEVAISLSLVFATVHFIVICVEIKYGLGTHTSTLLPYQLENQFLNLWISGLSYTLSLTFTKLAIVLQYIKVFPNRQMRRLCWVMVGLITLFSLSTLSLIIFNCWPISAFWTGKGRCPRKMSGWLTNSVLNILTDLIIIILPMPLLSSLRLPTKQKIGLIFVFALGVCVPVASGLRIKTMLITSRTADISYDNAETSIWSMVEVSIAVICACIPTIKPLIVKCRPQLPTSIPHKPASISSQYLRDNLSHGKLQRMQPAVLVGDEMSDTPTGNAVKIVWRKRDDARRGYGVEDDAWNEITTTDMTQYAEHISRRRKASEIDAAVMKSMIWV